MSDAKKMTPSNLIEMMVNSINKNDTGAFYTWAERYKEGLAFGGDTHQRIARLLHNKPKFMSLLDNLQSKVKGLVEQRELADENIYISAATESFLKPLLVEWANRDLYNYHGLGVRTKLLLHGPTGNGKSTLCRHIARAADLPFVEVKSDSIISSGLGNTGQNIGRIFENIKQPCVLFWDEIDSIGQRRGGSSDSSASVENERMVNSMLLNIDRLDSSVIFVGATNRREVLDSAFLRRFDTQFELPNPTTAEKVAFAHQLLAFHRLPNDFLPGGYEDLINLSDVRLYVVAAARKYIAQLVLENQLA